MICRRHLLLCAAASAAALLFSGCDSIPSISSPKPAAPAIASPLPPRVTLDTSPGIGPPAVAVAGWVEWVSSDGKSAVIELASPADPVRGRVWWVRDEELKPIAVLAVQLPRRGLRLGAIVTQGKARVGAEVVSADSVGSLTIPPLQANASK